MRAGCRGNALPKESGGDSSVHRAMQRRARCGLFQPLRAVRLLGCDELGGVGWRRGGRQTAPWARPGTGGRCRTQPERPGQERHGPEPAGQGRGGGPLAVAAAGASVHDRKPLAQTTASAAAERPAPEGVSARHPCPDQGYANPTGRGAAASGGHAPHIRPIGEDAAAAQAERDAGCGARGASQGAQAKGRKPRRWVVERTIAWLNRCRGTLVRYRKPEGWQLPRCDTTRLRPAVVQATTPAHARVAVLRWLVIHPGVANPILPRPQHAHSHSHGQEQ